MVDQKGKPVLGLRNQTNPVVVIRSEPESGTFGCLIFRPFGKSPLIINSSA